MCVGMVKDQENCHGNAVEIRKILRGVCWHGNAVEIRKILRYVCWHGSAVLIRKILR